MVSCLRHRVDRDKAHGKNDSKRHVDQVVKMEHRHETSQSQMRGIDDDVRDERTLSGPGLRSQQHGFSASASPSYDMLDRVNGGLDAGGNSCRTAALAIRLHHHASRIREPKLMHWKPSEFEPSPCHQWPPQSQQPQPPFDGFIFSARDDGGGSRMIDRIGQNQVRHIVADFNAGRHGQARRLCEEGLRRKPGDPSLNHLLAAILFAKGDVTRALVHVKASLAVEADNAPAQLLAGRIARIARDFDQALFHFGRAAELTQGAEALLERARTLDAAGDLKRALEAWRVAWRADPLSIEVAARLGRMLFDDGTLAEAASMLERAVAGDGSAAAYFDLGLVKQDLNDPVGAAAAYRKALEKRPDDAEAAVNLGIALQDTGDMDAAIEAYRAAYRLRATTFGTIAMSLTSAPRGRLWLDREALKRLLEG